MGAGRRVVTLASTTPRQPRRWPFIAIGIVLLIAAIAAAILSRAQFGAKASGERFERMRASPHWRDGSFVNDVPPAGYTFDGIGQRHMRHRSITEKGALALARQVDELVGQHHVQGCDLLAHRAHG